MTERPETFEMRSSQDMYKDFPALVRSSFPLYVREAGPQVGSTCFSLCCPCDTLLTSKRWLCSAMEKAMQGSVSCRFWSQPSGCPCCRTSGALHQGRIFEQPCCCQRYNQLQSACVIFVYYLVFFEHIAVHIRVL